MFESNKTQATEAAGATAFLTVRVLRTGVSSAATRGARLEVVMAARKVGNDVAV